MSADFCGILPVKTLIIGAQGRMGSMLLKRGRRIGLEMEGLDQPLTTMRISQVCSATDLALFCVPAAVLPDVLAKVCPYLPSTAVLADITSVKEGPLRQMARAWSGPVVGTHPLFGPNPEHGADLPVAVIPGAHAEAGHLALVENFFIRLGCRIFTCTAAQHDQAMARIQSMNFITNLAYFAMLAQQKELLPFLTPSFRRRQQAAQKMLTEDAQLFSGLFDANPYCHEAVHQYRQMLNLAAAGDIDLLCHRAQWWWERD